ncbi:MAG: cobalamin B12-binding domain-containing protein [Planctomycetes bacterium]|nr:cobalamin B12-binding domain-containing protein [Planctomycetota bacterium]
MRIVLISPKGPLYRHRGGIFRRSLRYAPLTLTTLASLVPPELGAEVQIFDEGIRNVPLDLDADLVGMTVITGSSMRAYELSAHFRKRGLPVVLGGPHVTLVPDDAQRHADSIVEGYAEDTWPELLRDFTRGAMKPRYRQAPNLSLVNRPFPRRDLMPKHRYATTNVFEATRSCIHDCEFCVAPAAWGREPYMKPVEDVIADIRQNGSRKIIFIDLNLISDKEYATRLFTALIPLRLQWFGLSTILICKDEPLLELAARSGCRGLLIGFESIRMSNLRSTRKGFNRPEDYQAMVDLLHRHGIAIQGCFVFGLDHDTPDVFLETAKAVVELGIDLPRYAITTPFPGTPFHARLEREGRILTRNWELYDGQHVVFRPAQMSVDELQRGTEAAWKYTYRFGSIARRLRKAAGPFMLTLAANLGYRHYANNLHKFYTCDWFIGPEARPIVEEVCR